VISSKRQRFVLAAILLGVACASTTLFIGQAKAEENGDPSPFLPGPNAMLVKQTCSQCHSPNVVITRTFTKLSARKMYQKMMGESPDTERGQKIVEYLYTVMGDKDSD
jgi:hypothetical protein